MRQTSMERREARFEMLLPHEVLQLMFDRDLADAYSDCVARSVNRNVSNDRFCFQSAYDSIRGAYRGYGLK
jgi:hypothetical protein